VRTITNTEILYSALGNPKVENLESIDTNCLICGKHIAEGAKAKKVLSSNFTNWGDCKDRISQYICKECAGVIKAREVRVNSFVADANNLYLLKKNDIEDYLFNLGKYVTGEFVVGITQSFKKHNSFRCKVNSDPKRYFIREEDREYVFDVNKLKRVYEYLNDAYLQFSKDELQTGNYKMISIEQFGLEKYYSIYEKFPKNMELKIKFMSYIRQDIKYKRNVYKGYIGIIAMQGSRELIKMAYQSGLGSKNGIGFGLIEKV
jgi:hypothetical protein